METAYERVKGKKPTVLGVEFGEKVLYKVHTHDKMEKISPRLEFYIFVGVRRTSGEVWIATRDKLQCARSIRRIPVEQRWGDDCLSWVQGVPWNLYKDAPDADGDLPEGIILVEPRDVASGSGDRVIVVETKSKPPREFQIRLEDAKKHGYTSWCGGCSSWFRGLARQPHTEACREDSGSSSRKMPE